MDLVEIDIKEKLLEISKRGFIKTKRKGDTGIGYTLETILGIEENNSGEPDFIYREIPVELKAQREHVTSNVTLITKVPHWNPLSSKEIIEKYGYLDKRSRKALKITLKATGYNAQKMKLEIDEENNRLNIVHETDGVICYFELDDLMEHIKKKLFENLLIVVAKSKKIENEEYFHYTTAFLVSKLTEDAFKKMIEDGLMVFEFRMHIKPSGEVRDHGPGFRLNRNLIENLFETKEIILDEE